MKISLRNALIFRLSLVVICVNIIISILFYSFSVRLAKEEFLSSIAVESVHFADIFTQQLWLYDIKALNHLADMAFENPDVIGISLQDHKNNPILSKGVFVGKNVTTIEKDLIHQSGRSIGKLSISYLDSSRGKLESLILKITILIVLATIILTITFISLLLKKKLDSPLATLKNDMAQLASGTFRKSKLTNQHEEIQSMIDAYNQVADALEKREDEKQLLENEIRQKHKMEALGTMAGGVAHDFNNLLSITTGNLELIRRRSATGKNIDSHIANIQDATDRAIEMVKQILAFSRRVEQQLINIDFKALITDTLTLLRSTTPSSVKIETTTPADPVYVRGDKTQLQQVFLNFCTNAIHAMNEQGLLKVSLTTASLPQNLQVQVDASIDQYAKLTIKDTGIGIDDEIISKIFDPFFTTKKVGEGTGMGLSMCHGVIKQLGGVVAVESAPGEGAEFTVYIPQIKNDTVKTTTQATGNVALPKGTETILLIDDEHAILEASIEMLTDLGYTVIGIADSKEALETFKLEPEQYDLIITDQTMPNLSGVELAVELLNIKPDTQIILRSGFSAKVSEDQAKAIGIKAYLHKPVSAEKLAKTIRQVLDKRI